MDDLLARDPTVTPVATLTTQPFSRGPMRAIDPSSADVGEPFQPSQASDASSKPSPSAGRSAATRAPRKRLNAIVDEDSAELKRALLDDIKDSKLYREAKLAILKDIASVLRGDTQQ